MPSGNPLATHTISQIPRRVNSPAELFGADFETEVTRPDGSRESAKVGTGVLIQAFGQTLPGPNDRRDLRKHVRCYNANSDNYQPGSSTLVELNPEFLCLFTTCTVEFGLESVDEEYGLRYDATGPLRVYVDGRFTGDKVSARWVRQARDGNDTFTITPTVSDNGIQANKTYVNTNSEALWRLKLTPTLTPAFTAFAVNGQASGLVPRGKAFPAGPVLFTWDMSNAANLLAGSLSIQDVTAAQTLGLQLVNNGEQILNAPGFTAGLGPVRAYRIAGTSTKGDAISADLVLTGVPSLYYGATTLNPTQMLTALQNGQPLTSTRLAGFPLVEVLRDNKALNHTYDCSGGKYIHALWDTAYGLEPAFGQVRSGVNTFSAYTVAGATITDAFGILRSYRLLSTGIQYGAAVNLNILS